MTTSIDIPAVRATVAEWLTKHDLSRGVGSAEHACTIAAINLAISGELSDDLHPCMSPVIHQWAIRVQDRMPEELRNSAGWKALVPLIAGSAASDDIERARLDVLMEHMWTVTLPIAGAALTGKARERDAWDRMLAERTADAADAAAYAATYAAYAATYAAYAARAAADAAYAAYATAHAAYAAVRAAADAAYATANAADATANAAYATGWATLDPVGLLGRLLAVSE